MKQEEQLTGWQDPTAGKQMQAGLSDAKTPTNHNVGMGQKPILKTEPQFS